MKQYTPPVTTQIDSRHYEIDLSGDKVHIGSANNEFTPVIRFNRFNLESFVELNLIGGGNITKFTNASLVNGVVTAENNYFKLEYKAVELKPPYNEFGGIDYKITVKQPSGLNTITFTYNHQACNAYLQPPLTQAEIDEGCYRPDYVINSIAFYHDTKGGMVTESQKDIGLTTGKIGHLYRMRVTDANNNQTWADWGFGGGQSQITLTVDATWLASAVYPIVITPVGDTFGYSDEGQSSIFTGPNKVRMYSVTYAAVCTGISMSISATWNSGVTYAQMAVYDSSLNLVDNAYTGSAEITEGAKNWWSANFASSPSFDGDYYLFYNVNLNTNISYDAGDGTLNYTTSTTFGTWPSSLTVENVGGNYKPSIYCTYAGGTDTVKSSTIIFGNLVTASRVRTISRSSTALIAIKAIALRNSEIIRAATVLFANVVSAVVEYIKTRTALISFGLLIPEVGFDNIGSSSVTIANKVIASREITFARTALILFGNTTTAVRNTTVIRNSSVLFGEVVSASRSTEIIRTSSVLVANKSTALRNTVISRLSTALIAVKSTAIRSTEIIRSASVIFANAVTAAMEYVQAGGEAFIESATVIFGNLVSASRQINITRASTTIVSNLVSASRITTITRTSSILIGNKAIALRNTTITKLAQISLGSKVTAQRVVAYSRTSIQWLGLKVTAIRITTINRLSAVLIGSKAIASRLTNIIRSSTVVFGNKVSAIRSITYSRVSAVLYSIKVSAVQVAGKQLPVIALTLYSRLRTFTLRTRSLLLSLPILSRGFTMSTRTKSLTLQTRSLKLTLPDRRKP